MEEENKINHPEHYNGGCSIECWDLMAMITSPHAVFDWCINNAIKYCYRYKSKHPDNPKEDLNKALECLKKADDISSSALHTIEFEDYMDRIPIIRDWIYKQIEIIDKKNKEEGIAETSNDVKMVNTSGVMPICEPEDKLISTYINTKEDN